MKCLVFYDTPGQMCNRFWSYIDSVGWAIENNAKVQVLFWDNSLKHYDKLRDNKYIKFPFYSQFLFKIFGENRYLNFLKHVFTNKYARYIYRKFGSKFVNAVRSYERHNNHDYYPKHLSLIRDLFKPSKAIQDKVEAYFAILRSSGFKVVGMHVRRGDYEKWRGGNFITPTTSITNLRED